MTGERLSHPGDLADIEMYRLIRQHACAAISKLGERIDDLDYEGGAMPLEGPMALLRSQLLGQLRLEENIAAEADQWLYKHDPDWTPF